MRIKVAIAVTALLVVLVVAFAMATAPEVTLKPQAGVTVSIQCPYGYVVQQQPYDVLVKCLDAIERQR